MLLINDGLELRRRMMTSLVQIYVYLYTINKQQKNTIAICFIRQNTQTSFFAPVIAVSTSYLVT